MITPSSWLALTVLSLQGLSAGLFCEMIFSAGSVRTWKHLSRPLLFWLLESLLLILGLLLPEWGFSAVLVLTPAILFLVLSNWLFRPSLKQALLIALCLILVPLFADVLCLGIPSFMQMMTKGASALPGSLYLFCAQLMILFLLLGIASALRQKKARKSDWSGLWLLICGFGALGAAVLSSAQRIMHADSVAVSGNDVFVFLVLYLCGFVFLTLLFFFQKRHTEKELDGVRECMEAQNSYYVSLDQASRSFEKTRSEYADNISTLLSVLEHASPEHASQVMEDLYGSMDRGRIPRYCSSPAINAILHEKEQICLQDHIRFAIDLKLDGPLMIPSLDLCIALGNILDNALRAARRLEGAEDPFIEIRGRLIQNNLILECRNACPENRKKVIYGSGYGQQILQDLARTYHGSLQTKQSRRTDLSSARSMVYTCTLILENTVEEMTVVPASQKAAA